MHEIIQCPKCQQYRAFGKQHPLRETEEIPLSLVHWLLEWSISIGACLMLAGLSYVIWLITRKDFVLIGLMLFTLTLVFLCILARDAIPLIRKSSLYAKKRIIIGYNWRFRCQACHYDWVWPDDIALPATITQRLTGNHDQAP